MLRTVQAEPASVAGRGGGQPVAAVLEGVGGQRDGAGVWIQGRPGRAVPVIVQLGQRGGQGVLVGPVPVQRGDHRRLGPPDGLGQGVGDRGGQYRVWGQLHKRALTGGQTLNQSVVEPDRLAQVAIPVVGVHRGGVERVGRKSFSHGGVQRDTGWRRIQVGQLGQQALAQGFDLSRMRGVIDGDGPDLDAVAVTDRGELLQRGQGCR